jgi:hypothetical protein
MKTKSLLSVTIILIFVVISCKKQMPDSPIVRPNDSTVISEVIYLDTTALPSPDTLGFVTYRYDVSKRLTSKVVTEGVIPDQYISTYKYIYSGTDTLPFKVTTVRVQPLSDIAYDTLLLFYNPQGIVIEDSFIEYFDPSTSATRTTRHFVITVGNVYQQTTEYDYYSGAVQSDIFKNFYQLIQNGNISTQIDTVATGQYNQYYFLYDDKINPLYKNAIHYPIFFPEHLFYEDPQPKNNITSVNQYQYGVGNYQFDYLFVYNENDLPLELEGEVSVGVKDGTVVRYFYTN